MSEHSITTIPSTLQRTRSAILGCFVVVVLQIFLTATASAEDEYRSVVVADPYLEMRTGAGIGYPIFHVVDRGDAVDIVMQRTDWYLVRTENEKEGWVNRQQMEKTMLADGSQLDFGDLSLEDMANSKWELGVLAGDFGGANIVSLYGGYSLNPNVSLELWGSQILGNFSNGWMGSINIVHEAFPEWRVFAVLYFGRRYDSYDAQDNHHPGRGSNRPGGSCRCWVQGLCDATIFVARGIQKLRGLYEPRRK